MNVDQKLTLNLIDLLFLLYYSKHDHVVTSKA